MSVKFCLSQGIPEKLKKHVHSPDCMKFAEDYKSKEGPKHGGVSYEPDWARAKGSLHWAYLDRNCNVPENMKQENTSIIIHSQWKTFHQWWQFLENHSVSPLILKKDSQ